MASSRKSISLREKFEIVSRIEKGEKQSSISTSLGLTKSTVNTIWKKKDAVREQFESSELCKNAKRFRVAEHADVDAALLA